LFDNPPGTLHGRSSAYTAASQLPKKENTLAFASEKTTKDRKKTTKKIENSFGLC
jgi:hypothetical protein